MAKLRKPTPRRKMAGLSDIQQHALFEFLRTNSYDKGCAWVLEKTGITVAPMTLCEWWSWYASRQLAVGLAQSTANLATQLRDAGYKVTKDNLDDFTLDYFQRQAALGVEPGMVLRYYTERKKVEISERTLALQEKRLDRLLKMEEESRQALTSGKTESEMLQRFREILGFTPEGS